MIVFRSYLTTGIVGRARIDEIGSDVKTVKYDKIAYASMPLGAYSKERIIPSKIAAKLPDYISPKIAATLMTKGLTTNYLICKTYKLKAGETILFHAAAGGVKYLLNGRIASSKSNRNPGIRKKLKLQNKMVTSM